MLQSVIYDHKAFIVQGTVWMKRGFWGIIVPLTSFCKLLFMQNGQNLSQVLFKPYMKFGGILQKFNKTKTSFYKILCYFVSFMTEVF